jgi:hypothetical protein
MGHVPSEWVGKIVTVCYLSQGQSGCGPEKTYLEERATGELVRIESDAVILNLGWDGRDYHEATISGSWVRIEKDKQTRKLEGEEADKRKQVRTQAEELKSKAVTAVQQSHFGLTEANLRCEVQEIAGATGFDTMPTEGWGDSLTSWVEKANGVIERYTTAEQEIVTLQQRQDSGEVLVDFGGRYRWGGATNQSRHWVIRPDGQERGPDSYPRERNGDGSNYWRLVGPEELALMWSKAYTAAPHEFEVAKLPTNGCTTEQLATVERLEREIGERFNGTTGMSGMTTSPEIGKGWDLRKKNSPVPSVAIAPVSSEEIVDAVAALRAKFGKGK